MPGTQYAHPEHDERRQDRMPAAAAQGPAPGSVLTVGHAEDQAERDADRVADAVIARLQPAVHGEDGHPPVRRAAAPGVRPEVGFTGGDLSPELSAEITSARGGGEPLATPLRRRMEEAFGGTLSGVRVHTGPAAATLNRKVAARAFTTGQDIFFGEGEYRPDTAEGERVLAHEIAHTRQAGGVHRVHRLWDFSQTVDYGKLRTVSTISSGQPVYFLTDSDGDQVAVKAESAGIGISMLSEALHNQAGAAKSVKHFKVSDKNSLVAALSDQTKWDAVSIAKLGKFKRTATGLEGIAYRDLKMRRGDDVVNAMSDLDVGKAIMEETLGFYGGQSWMAMTMATGTRAQEASRSADNDQGILGNREATKFRRILQNRKHNVALGHVTAIDLFMGNGDRVVSGNVGNWFYADMSGVMTLIDHVDRNANDVTEDFLMGKKEKVKGTNQEKDLGVHGDLEKLAKSKIPATARLVLNGMANGIESDIKGNDAGFGQWLDANGGMQRNVIEEALEEGLRQGRDRLIKIFTATRFTIGGRKDRKIKKDLKAASQNARQVDMQQDDFGNTNTNAYYEMLKARATWLKKN